MYSNVTASHLVIGVVSRNTPPPTMLNHCMIQRCRSGNIKVIEHALSTSPERMLAVKEKHGLKGRGPGTGLFKNWSVF